MTVRLYVAVPPAVIVAGPDFVRDRSARVITPPVAVSVLSAWVGSGGVAALAVAVLASGPGWREAGTVPVMVTAKSVSRASVARVQVTRLPATVQDPAGEAEIPVIPAGTWSVT